MGTVLKIISFLIILISITIVKYIGPISNFIDKKNLAILLQNEFQPLLYDDDFCKKIDFNNITFRSNIYKRIIDLFAPKTILYANLHNHDIVFKSLIHPDNFYKIRNEYYNIFNNNICIDVVKKQINSIIRLVPDSVIFPKLQLCPYMSNIENFFKKLNITKHRIKEYINLWTVFQSNPEPVMLKLLSPPTWPVPEFYGACGQVIAVEYCGHMLSDFYSAAWAERASLAFQLLDGALKFTFQDPNFAYYLTDMSPDNIAVSNLGKLKFIDLENVILVDKDYFDGGNYNHTSSHVACKDCIVIDSHDICRHKTSDHNVYAVCKEIFSESSIFPKGFLHSRPRSLELEHLDSLITDCVEGSGKSRFETATAIMSILKTYTLQ